MTINDARERLIRLQAERLTARELGVEEPSSYMDRLSAAIEQARDDYTLAAVVEIASLRRDLERPIFAERD
ncbi:MAG: hypothetical protein LC790_05200 [Actinobacteria bacterium]|nr:hypothetical protein [Actinomycetota bacterium]